MVPKAGIRHVHVCLNIGHITQIQTVGGGAHGLAAEHIADRRSRLRLKGLMLELKFHLMNLTVIIGQSAHKQLLS